MRNSRCSWASTLHATDRQSGAIRTWRISATARPSGGAMDFQRRCGNGSASSRMMAAMVSAALGRANARFLAASSYTIRPKENWSLRKSTSSAARLLRIHVGHYPSLFRDWWLRRWSGSPPIEGEPPRIWPIRNREFLTRPGWGVYGPVIRMLSGFRSRCVKPAA